MQRTTLPKTFRASMIIDDLLIKFVEHPKDFYREVQPLMGWPFQCWGYIRPKHKKCKDFWKPSKPCHVGIHWIAFTECSQMSTHVPGFHSFSGCLHHFVLSKLATSSIRVKTAVCLPAGRAITVSELIRTAVCPTAPDVNTPGLARSG